MYCPKCATQNADGASYCRACGANISLVPQALTGQLPQVTPEERGGRRSRHGRKEASLDNAFRNAFMGLAFLMVAIALAFSRMGTGWWFWMLIPAFSMMGTGVAQYIRVKEMEKRSLQSAFARAPAMPDAPRADYLPASDHSDMLSAPPSVTEGTTRHLGAEAPTKNLGAPTESR